VQKIKIKYVDSLNIISGGNNISFSGDDILNGVSVNSAISASVKICNGSDFGRAEKLTIDFDVANTVNINIAVFLAMHGMFATIEIIYQNDNNEYIYAAGYISIIKISKGSDIVRYRVSMAANAADVDSILKYGIIDPDTLFFLGDLIPVAPPTITHNTINNTIEMYSADAGLIYYTTNGDNPTNDSTEYTEPIPFAFGTYKAIVYVGAVFSEITTEIFSATLWTPANTVTALWLDANDSATITKDGSNLVSQWNDKSGNAKNAMATSTDRPTITGSKMVFDGVDNYMLTQGKNIFNSASDVTVFILHKAYSINSTGNGVFSLQNGLNNTDGFFHTIYRNNLTNNLRGLFTSNGIVANQTILYPSVSLATNTDYIMGHGASASTHFIRTNGTESTTARSSQCLFVGDKANIGCYYDFTLNFHGDISEIVVLGSLATTEIRQKIEGYLAWKWDGINGNTALVSALPIDHPYKSQAPTT